MRVVGFRMAGFMLSGSGIRVFVLGNVELGWAGWGESTIQCSVGGWCGCGVNWNYSRIIQDPCQWGGSIV